MANTFTQRTAHVTESGNIIEFTKDSCGYSLNEAHASHVIVVESQGTTDGANLQVLTNGSGGLAWVTVHTGLRPLATGSYVWAITPVRSWLVAGATGSNNETLYESIPGRFLGFRIDDATTSSKATITTTPSGL